MALQAIQLDLPAVAIAPERAHGAELMKYAPSLDGVRAVAILAVLAFHTMPRVFRGGFTGVDVFFVLSGYLITSVILHDIRNGTFSMREFYLRRIQRLLPNAVVMVMVTVALSLVFLLPSMAVKVAGHGLWAIFNLSNVYILRSFGGYWGDSANSAPLLHTWSLAVEEQFYLAFPLTLWLLSRRTSIFIVTVFLSLASFALYIYSAGLHPEATFYLLPTRAWEPLIGAILATYRVPVTIDRPLRRTRAVLAMEFAGWGGLALIVAGFLFVKENNNLRGVMALAPALGALTLLVSIADGTTRAARLLSKPFPVLIGKLSYSLYLWHWPMIVIGRTYADLIGISRRAGTLIGLAAGIALAVIAYRVIEHPLRQRGRGRGRRLLVLGTAFFVCFLVCLVASVRHPVSDPLGRFDRVAFYGRLYNVGAIARQSSIRYADVLFPEQPSQSETWRNGGIVHNWGPGNPRVVVIGSSHAVMYAKLIDDICRQEGLSVAFLAANAAPVFFPSGQSPSFPTLDLSRDFDAARRKWIREWNPDAVLVADRWDHYAGDRAAFDRRLRELVGELAPHTGRIVLFSQVPVLRVGKNLNLREFVTWHLKTFRRFPKIAPDSNESTRKSSNIAIEAVARDFPEVQLMRVDPQFYMEDGSVRFSSGRSFFYADDNHLSQAGVEQLRPLITRTIVAIKEAAHSPAGAQDRITPNIQATFSASRFESTRQ
jgi:peptidoglycan/LPS O-acetylase OafA/YrhL